MSITSFLWPVCVTGYFFETPRGETREDAVLKPGKLWPTTEYAPFLTEPALFLKFAELDGDSDTLVQFANRFGTLCRTVEPPDTVPKLNQASGATRETLAFWRVQITAMQKAVSVWQLVREEKADPLNLSQVATAIEAGCNGRIVSHYQFDRLTRRCAWGRVPSDLIGALWLQLADAVSLSKQYRRCPAPECGNWYELSPATKGPDKNHCSVACKQRAYRQRKQRALELFNMEWNLERIAQELDANVETIKGWLTIRFDEKPDDKGEQGKSKKGRRRKGDDLPPAREQNLRNIDLDE